MCNRRSSAGIGLAAFAATATLWLPPGATAAVAAAAGVQLVYLSDTNHDGTFGIYREDASAYPSGAPSTVLADSSTRDVVRVLVSPDGLRVAALVRTPGTGNESLQVMNLDGSNRHAVANASTTAAAIAKIVGFDWSGANQLIFGHLYATPPDSPVQNTDLRLVSAVGGSASIVPNSAGLIDPAVNRVDGRIAAVDTTQTAFPDQLVIYRPSDHSRGPGMADGRLFSPTWSRDGTEIAYGVDLSTPGFGPKSVLGVIALSGTSWQPLVGIDFRTSGLAAMWFNENPQFAPDGTLWFDRVDHSVVHEGQDLWQATPTPSGWDETNRSIFTATQDEASPSFGPVDTTPPAAAVLRPFQLAGSTTVVNWTPPRDLDYSHVVIKRTNPDGTTKTFTGYGASYADHTTVGATYTYQIEAVVDGAGNTIAVTAPPRKVQALAPPGLVVSNPTALTSATKPFVVRWRNRANPAGSHYRVQYAIRNNVGGLSEHPWYPNTTSGAALVAAPTVGQTYYFRAQVLDAFGNSSAPTGYHAAAVAYDQGSGTFSRGWSTVLGQSYWLGSERATSSSGASLAFTVTSRGIALIGDLLPSGGRFKVYVGRSYRGTFSTASSTTQRRRVLYGTSFATTATRTIRIVAVLNSGQSLRIDGIAGIR